MAIVGGIGNRPLPSLRRQNPSAALGQAPNLLAPAPSAPGTTPPARQVDSLLSLFANRPAAGHVYNPLLAPDQGRGYRGNVYTPQLDPSSPGSLRAPTGQPGRPPVRSGGLSQVGGLPDRLQGLLDQANAANQAQYQEMLRTASGGTSDQLADLNNTYQGLAGTLDRQQQQRQDLLAAAGQQLRGQLQQGGQQLQEQAGRQQQAEQAAIGDLLGQLQATLAQQGRQQQAVLDRGREDVLGSVASGRQELADYLGGREQAINQLLGSQRQGQMGFAEQQRQRALDLLAGISDAKLRREEQRRRALEGQLASNLIDRGLQKSSVGLAHNRAIADDSALRENEILDQRAREILGVENTYGSQGLGILGDLDAAARGTAGQFTGLGASNLQNARQADLAARDQYGRAGYQDLLGINRLGYGAAETLGGAALDSLRNAGQRQLGIGQTGWQTQMNLGQDLLNLGLVNQRELDAARLAAQQNYGQSRLNAMDRGTGRTLDVMNQHTIQGPDLNAWLNLLGQPRRGTYRSALPSATAATAAASGSAWPQLDFLLGGLPRFARYDADFAGGDDLEQQRIRRLWDPRRPGSGDLLYGGDMPLM